MLESKDTQLHCPQCGKNRFSILSTSEVELAELNFHKIPKPLGQKIVYVCINCGFAIKDKGGMSKRFLVIVTGNSESYKRQAVVAAGYSELYDKDQNRQQFKDMLFIQDRNILFVTKDGSKKPYPPAILETINQSVIDTVDCSTGDKYDEVASSVERLNNYYTQQGI